MLSNLSRRMLSSSRRRWAGHVNWSYTTAPSFSSTLSCFVAPTSRQPDDNPRRLNSRYSTPISMHSFVQYSQSRLFSATVTPNDKDKTDSSFGDRARERATRARKAGARGAKTAGEMMRRYGPVFVGTYFTVYVSTLAALFGGVDSGLLDPLTIFEWISNPEDHPGEDSKTTVALVVEYMENHSMTKPYAHVIEKNPHFANLAVAWVAVKFTEPIRLALTLAIVPKLARHFGFVKVVKAPDGEEVEVRHDEVEEVVKELEKEEREMMNEDDTEKKQEAETSGKK